MNNNTKKRILLIEDETLIVDMYKEKLKFEGFRVTTAMDGKKALTRAKQGADLILLDVLMPGLNGFEVLKRLKADKETADIPVIVLTNIGTEATANDKNFALSLGAADYMVKSLHTPDEVVARIHEILEPVAVSK